MSDLDLGFSYQHSSSGQSSLWATASRAIQAAIDRESSPEQLTQWFRQVESRLFKIDDDISGVARVQEEEEADRARYAAYWSPESWFESDQKISRVNEALNSFRASKRCCQEILSWIRERQASFNSPPPPPSPVVVLERTVAVV